MAQLIAKARQLGVPPENYARQLVENGLALEREAESLTMAEIMRPVRQASGTVNENEILNLVEKARTDYHSRVGRAKKK
jgi:hypothetical protein